MTASSIVGVFCVLSFLLPSLGAQAQNTVYRCGPDGREYSATPCPGGKPVEVGDARSIEQQRQARDAARSEKRMAAQLAAERRRRETTEVRRGAARLDAAAAASESASKPMAKKGKKKPSRPMEPNLTPPVRGASAAAR